MMGKSISGNRFVHVTMGFYMNKSSFHIDVNIVKIFDKCDCLLAIILNNLIYL